MEREALLKLAIETAAHASEAVMRIYNSGDYESYSKQDDSPVTTADYHSNDIIMAALQSATPDIPIMSEEQKDQGLSVRQNWQRYWLIDPIDGTQEFIARSGDFAINIALIEDHEPVIGVICWPSSGTIYYASKGQGAFKQTPQGTEAIRVREFTQPEQDAIVIAISRRQPIERVMNQLSQEREYTTLPLGSCALKSCFIAEGKADLFLRIGVTGEWDTGAPQCIVSEAGGQILAADLTPLSYNRRESLINPDFVVLGDQQVPWQDVVLYQSSEKS